MAALMARRVKLDERNVIQLEGAKPDGDSVYVQLGDKGGQSECVFSWIPGAQT